jgi:hypothetical protein
MRKTMLGIVGAAVLMATPVLAQKQPDVCQVSVWTAKAGSEAAWAEGRKKHMEFHKAQKDAFGWFTWEVLNGDRAGSFLTGTFDHYWKDYDGRDAFDALDGADIARTTGPLTASSTTGFWIHMSGASRTKPGATVPSKYSQLTHYYVNLADVPRFEDALETAKAELDKISWPTYSSWYRLASGGDGPHYVLATGRDSYADFAPPEKTLIQALSESMGPRKADELMSTVRESTAKLYTEVLQYRPDLSYVPAAK